jgi:hypothetical protein
VTNELNALLTALYVVTDDHVVEARTGRDRAPPLSDSELITSAVGQVLQGYHCERHGIRHIHSSAEWRAMFPYLPDQSADHKRLKNAQPLLGKAILTLASMQANLTSKPTTAGPSPGYSPTSPNACWPWPPGPGTTGPPASPANEH